MFCCIPSISSLRLPARARWTLKPGSKTTQPCLFAAGRELAYTPQSTPRCPLRKRARSARHRTVALPVACAGVGALAAFTAPLSSPWSSLARRTRERRQERPPLRLVPVGTALSPPHQSEALVPVVVTLHREKTNLEARPIPNGKSTHPFDYSSTNCEILPVVDERITVTVAVLITQKISYID